jgi:hypothetical protein
MKWRSSRKSISVAGSGDRATRTVSRASISMGTRKKMTISPKGGIAKLHLIAIVGVTEMDLDPRGMMEAAVDNKKVQWRITAIFGCDLSSKQV